MLENVNIYDGKGGYDESTEVTSIPIPRALPCRDMQRSAETSSRPQMVSSVDWGLSIWRTTKADGAPTNDFTRLPEDNVRFERLMQTGDSLKPGKNVILSDRKILSDQLRAVSGRQRI